MDKVLGALCVLAAVLLAGRANAADGFEAVRCNAPVPAALMGKHMANDRVVMLEARHKDIGLHDLGAEEVNDNQNTIWWMICGKEYVVLEDRDVVRDVLPFPAHSKQHPEFLGICRRDGKDTDEVMAVLDNTGANAGQPMLPATAAWSVDEHARKFVIVPTGGMMCPRTGISTASGER